jgi:DNA-binding NtrC family response regulator
VVNIEIPPLRERKEDIPLLIAAFIKEIAEENQKVIEGIDSRAAAALYNHPWPGNVRELRNCIESAIVMAKSNIITTDDLPPYIGTQSDENYVKIPAGTTLTDVEKEIIEFTLNQCNGNKSKAAEVLGIGRKTLHRKIQEYDLGK